MQETIGQRIARLRLKNGLTQKQLADRIAVSRVAISHFEMGLTFPSERTITLIAGVFKLSPIELILETSYPHAKAVRLPASTPFYGELDLMLALFENDLVWLDRVIDCDLHKKWVTLVRAQWLPRLMSNFKQSLVPQDRQRIESAIHALKDLRPDNEP